MLHFEGDQDFSQPVATVFAKLGDARFLAECIAGVEAVAKSEADEVLCTLRPGFSFVRGTLELTLKVLERRPEEALRVLAHAKGIGSGNDVEALLTFAARDGGSRVHWSADAKNFTGLLKMVPKGLMQGAAQKVIADAWEAVQAKLKG